MANTLELEIDCFGTNKNCEKVLETPEKVNVMIRRSDGLTTNDCDFYDSRSHKCNALETQERESCYLQMGKIGLQLTSAKVVECSGRDYTGKGVLKEPEQAVSVRFSRGLHVPLCRLYQNGTGECRARKTKTKRGYCPFAREAPLIK